jgi:predicted ATPase
VSNLPRPLTSFVGREREIAEVRRLLGGARLVTLTGPPGTGKTRLALEVAAGDFPDGVRFVALASVTQPERVMPTIAQALEVREVSGQPLAESVEARLRGRALLLLLDNVEQVVTAGPQIGELLGTCPELRVLATSREALRVQGEHRYPVPPLPPAAAVQLFVARARAVRPDFALADENAPVVAGICRRLDCLPLAIELAAARVTILAPAALLVRLERRLPLLTGGPRDLPARQQTLRDALAWSHDLLDPAEQVLFRRLAVFVGGFAPEAAEALAGAGLDDLASLVGKSLLDRQEDDREPRFAMLETIREYGLERLAAAGELADLRRQHTAYFVALAEGLPYATAGFDRREREHDNLRAALGWFVENDDADGALRLAAQMCGFWAVRGYLSEGREQLARVLALPGAAARPAARAAVLGGLGRVAFNQGDYEAARACYEESLAVHRQLDDRRALQDLRSLANIARERGDLVLARAQAEEALALARREEYDVGACLSALGLIALHEGDHAAARRFLLEALELPPMDASGFNESLLMARLGHVAHAEGKLDEARTRYEESLAFQRRLGDKRQMAGVLTNLGLVLTDQGAGEQARAALDEGLSLAAELHDRVGTALALEGFAGLAAADGAAERAVRLAGAADALRRRAGVPAPSTVGAWLARWLQVARRTLGPAAAAASWEHGRAMDVDRAVADARADVPGATACPPEPACARGWLGGPGR